MKHPLAKDKDYSAWLKELKNKVRLVQIKAAVKGAGKNNKLFFPGP